jgi:hypothetical protein
VGVGFEQERRGDDLVALVERRHRARRQQHRLERAPRLRLLAGLDLRAERAGAEDLDLDRAAGALLDELLEVGERRRDLVVLEALGIEVGDGHRGVGRVRACGTRRECQHEGDPLPTPRAIDHGSLPGSSV